MNRYDPETMEGDYAEAYQIWHHKFQKDGEKVKECFKDIAYVPFEPIFHVDAYTPGWKNFVKNVKKHIGKEDEL